MLVTVHIFPFIFTLLLLKIKIVFLTVVNDT